MKNSFKEAAECSVVATCCLVVIFLIPYLSISFIMWDINWFMNSTPLIKGIVRTIVIIPIVWGFISSANL